MLTRTLIALCALFAISACSTTSAPVTRHYPPAPYAQPPSANLYASAPFATLYSELFVCSAYGANIGEVGPRGEALFYTPYMYTPAGALLRAPGEGVCLSSGFGWRGSMGGPGREHTGLDLANPNGGFVYAAGDGWVRFADWRGGYGLTLEIDHGDGVATLYAHLSEIDPRLRPGMFVPAGAPVARMGMTGNATGVHLHYEVSVGGMRVDPLRYSAAGAPIG